MNSYLNYNTEHEIIDEIKQPIFKFGDVVNTPIGKGVVCSNDSFNRNNKVFNIGIKNKFYTMNINHLEKTYFFKNAYPIKDSIIANLFKTDSEYNVGDIILLDVENEKLIDGIQSVAGRPLVCLGIENGLLTYVPLSTKTYKSGNHPIIYGLKRRSIALCEQIQTVNSSSIKHKVDKIDENSLFMLISAIKRQMNNKNLNIPVVSH